MAGTDTIRGILYQQANAVALAVEVISSPEMGAMRVEGIDDIVDVELWGADELPTQASQYKTRQPSRNWAAGDIVGVLNKWFSTSDSDDVNFTFQTDGEFGPSVNDLRDEIAAYLTDGIEAPLTARGLTKFSRSNLARVKLLEHDVDGDAILNAAVLAMVRLQPTALLSGAEVFRDAEARVLKLFAAMFTAGSNPEPSARIRTRKQLAEIAGVDLTNIPVELWADVRAQIVTSLRNQRPSLLFDFDLPDTYATGQWIGHVGQTSLLQVPERKNLSRVSADAFSNFRFSVIAGPTGTGKTTAIVNAQRLLAEKNKVAIVINTDSEYRGDLVRAVTATIASLTGKPVGPSVARNALSDPDVILIIDRASELNDELRLQLKEDLANIDIQALRTCLTGRELGKLKGLCPAAPEEFVALEFDNDDQVRLSEALWNSVGKSSAQARSALSKIQNLLVDDLTRNPLLLTIGHWLELNGRLPASKANLYANVLELLGERSKESELPTQLPIVGGVFSRLIDDRQWTANAFKWHRYEEEVLEALPSQLRSSLALNRSTEAALNSGVILNNVRNQTYALHDSFADYLSALAMQCEIARPPTNPSWADATRLEFLLELEGLSDDIALSIARANPLLLARLSFYTSHVHQRPDAGLIAEYLEALLQVPKASMTLELTTNQPWCWARLTVDMGVTAEGAGDIRISAASQRGSLQLAIGLWETMLAKRLFGPMSNHLPDLTSLEKAQTALSAHATKVREEVNAIVGANIPNSNQGDVLEAIGPLGIRAAIGPGQVAPMGGQYFPLYYDNANDINISTTDDATKPVMSGQTDVSYFLRQSPRATAVDHVVKALSELVGKPWPRV